MIEDIKKVKSLVEGVLQGDLRARDYDIYLILKVWEKQGIQIPYPLMAEIMQKGHSPESIRRIRQKFQEAGLYLGEGRKARLEEEKNVREWSKGTLFEGGKTK